jgi:hypothetical protein
MVTESLVNNNKTNYIGSRSVSVDYSTVRVGYIGNELSSEPDNKLRRRQSTGRVLRRRYSSIGGDTSMLHDENSHVRRLPQLKERISQNKSLDSQRRVEISFGVPLVAQEFRRRASRQSAQKHQETSHPRRYSATGVFLTSCSKTRWLRNETRMRAKQLGVSGGDNEADPRRRRNVREGFCV